MGEVFRALSGFPNRRAIHVNFVPEYAPCFSSDGDIKKVEKTNHQDLSYFYEQYEKLNPGCAKECVLNFRIDEGLLLLKTRKELYDGLVHRGPHSVQLLNYDEFKSSLEDFLG